MSIETGKRQVVFVTRALWGGGAERVLHDLAHALTPGPFKPLVVHLFSEGKNQVSYGESVVVRPLEPHRNATVKESGPEPEAKQATQTSCAAPPAGMCVSAFRALCAAPLAGRLFSAARGPVNRLIGNVQAGFRITSSFLSASATGTSQVLLRSCLLCARFLISRTVLPREMRALPLIVRLQAFWLARIFEEQPKETLIVPFMEEAAVRVWLGQHLTKRPYIVSLHSYESINLPLIYPDPDRLRAEKRLFVKACRAARAIVVPSVACRQDLVDNFGMPPEQIRVISNPVDVPAIRERTKEPLPDLFDRDGRTLFLNVGRLSPDKNHKLLIETCSLLKERYSSFLVLCLGEGNMKKSLQADIEARGLSEHILLLGHVPNPYPFMREARALLVTSLVESFSLVLVEAMICGAVPISVDCPGGPREVLDNGKYGMLVPPGDPKALTNAMWDIAHDDELFDSYRKVGPQRAEEYDISRIALRWERLFQETVSADIFTSGRQYYSKAMKVLGVM